MGMHGPSWGGGLGRSKWLHDVWPYLLSQDQAALRLSWRGALSPRPGMSSGARWLPSCLEGRAEGTLTLQAWPPLPGPPSPSHLMPTCIFGVVALSLYPTLGSPAELQTQPCAQSANEKSSQIRSRGETQAVAGICVRDWCLCVWKGRTRRLCNPGLSPSFATSYL